MAKLPKVLAGPIVRRSTTQDVNVWLATSERFPDPELLLFDSETDGEIPADPSFRSVQLGANLFVHLLTARPHSQDFPADIAIAYDIVGGGQGLADLMNLRTLLLPGFDRPTFVLQLPDIGRLHAVYGSCRKMHGPRPDMMRAADTLMKSQPAGRPEVLLLGGDQIYADDVDETLLPHIHHLAIDLIGYPERVPGLPAAAHLPTIDRSKYFDKTIITSGHAKHHLLTFGEFSATYLFAWNQEMWKRTAVSGSAIPASDASFGAAAARRVLANIATYMIFDDHEITDDWFLNDKWRKRAIAADWAERIMTNGLCAFWAFQAWGNNPTEYDDNFIEAMEAFAQRGERMSDASFLLITHGRWSFLAPTSPPTLVLDTRTGRESSKRYADRAPPQRKDVSVSYLKYGYEPTTRKYWRNSDAPRLLGRHERVRLRRLLDSAPGSISPLVVIAPAPILGFRPIEEVQELVGAFKPSAGDLESWAANPRNMVDFVHLLLEQGVDFAVVLSGDVHYAFEIASTISTPKSTLRVAQFCSSALKNRPTGGQIWGAKFLRMTGAISRAIGWWDFRKGSDGPITRHHADNGNTYKDLVRRHAGPTFIVKEQLNVRGGDRVLLLNNIGELIVDDAGVHHRFWRPIGSTMKPDSFLDWQVAAWPVTRHWP